MHIKFCQSCGMPLKTSEVIGTNVDGSSNEDYCVYCFKNGAFTQDLTMEEAIAASLKYMKEMYKENPDFDEKDALNKMNQYFPKLKRWKNK